MPKNTYYKIPKEKQIKIIKAGEDLFSEHYYENVDVKMIVNEAMIPRGSFYAYFENIHDFYKTVVKSLQENRINEMETIIKDSNPSFFNALIRLFKKDITASIKSKKKLLIQHYFRYIITQNLGYSKSHLNEKERPIYRVLDHYKSEFKLSDSEWDDFLELTMNTYLMTYMKSIDDQLSINESINLLESRFKILERGIK